jgi:hypothetical protein
MLAASSTGHGPTASSVIELVELAHCDGSLAVCSTVACPTAASPAGGRAP